MKDKTTAIVLAIFLGGIGAHQFYLKNTTKAVLYLLFFWTGIPLLISFFDVIILLTKSKDDFDRLYNKQNVRVFLGLSKYLNEYPQATQDTLKLLYWELKYVKGNHGIAQKQVQDFMHTRIKETGLNEKEQIKTYLTNGLKEEVLDYDNVFNKMYFSTLVENCIEDESLSPDEVKFLHGKATELNIEEYNSPNSIRESFNYYIKNWELNNGIFEELTPDFILNRNEVCFYRNQQVELLERKEVTNRLDYAGPRARVKIAKGLSYNLGSYSYSTSKTLKEISKGIGIVNVTTKRILFKTDSKNTVIRLSEIVDIEPYQNGVVIFRSSGNPYIFKTENGLELYQAINGGVRNLQSTS